MSKLSVTARNRRRDALRAVEARMNNIFSDDFGLTQRLVLRHS